MNNMLTIKSFKFFTRNYWNFFGVFLHSSANIAKMYVNRKSRETNAEYTTSTGVLFEQVKQCFHVSSTFVKQHVRILQTPAAHRSIQLGASICNNKTSTMLKERKESETVKEI